ncbi:MAG: PEP-CTERM sorting domain-containing protein [Planctomycetota bacterium]
MTKLHHLGVAALMFCFSPTVFGELVIDISSTTIGANETGRVTASVRNTGTIAVGVDFADFGFFIQPIQANGSEVTFGALETPSLPNDRFDEYSILPEYLFSNVGGDFRYLSTLSRQDTDNTGMPFFYGDDESTTIIDFEPQNAIIGAGESRLLIVLDIESVLDPGVSPSSFQGASFEIAPTGGTFFSELETGAEFEIDFDGSTFGIVTVVAVPEPSSLAALAMMSGMALIRRRRR